MASQSILVGILLLAVLGIIVCAALLLIMDTKEEGLPMDPQALTEEEERSPSTATPETAAPPVAQEQEETISYSTFLSGNVMLKEDNSPVAGVKVTPFFYEKDLLHHPHEQVMTDETGSFRIPLKKNATLKEIVVAAGLTTAGYKDRTSLHIPEGEAKEVTLMVSRGALVRGIVINRDGNPVPGARVLGWCMERNDVDNIFGANPDRITTTDEKGNFTIKHLGERFVLDANAPGMVCYERLHGTLRHGEEVSGLTLVIGPACVLRGRVLDPSMQPLEGIPVKAWHSWSSGPSYKTDLEDVARSDPVHRQVFTEKDGAFVFNDLAHMKYRISVKAPDYPEWKASYKPSAPVSMAQTEEKRFLEIVLDRGIVFRCQVLSHTGKALFSAKVRISSKDGETSHKGETNRKGICSFFGLMKNQTWRLHVQADDHAIHVLEPIPLGAKDLRFVKVALEESRSLAGRVLDEQGAPVYNSRITIEGDRELKYDDDAALFPKPTWESSFDLHTTYTDRDGRFRIDQLYAGEFLIKAADPENQELFAEMRVSSGTEDLILRLGDR